MNLLLDTHTFLWFLSGDARLPLEAREAISNLGNRVYVSAASTWEISTKHRLGKLPGFSAIVEDLESVVTAQNFEKLAITVRHGQSAGALAIQHKDPFDRMLIAQAIEEHLTLISNEQIFDVFGISRLW